MDNMIEHHYLDVLINDRPYLSQSLDTNLYRVQKKDVPKRAVVGVKKQVKNKPTPDNNFDFKFIQPQENGHTKESKDNKEDDDSKTKYCCSTSKCEEEAKFLCGQCQSVYYCSEEHQQQDWASHKKVCRNLLTLTTITKINTTTTNSGSSSDPSSNTEERLVAVTKSELSKKHVGRIIFEERPLVILPQLPSPEDYQVCIDCCGRIAWNELSYACSGCGWPCCHETKCDPQVSLHSKEECSRFGSLQKYALWTTKTGYLSLSLMRILVLKRINREIFDILLKLAESHGQDNRHLEHQDLEDRSFAIHWLRDFHRVPQKALSDDEICKIWTLIRFFCFNTPITPAIFSSSNTTNIKRAMMIYPNIQRLFPHSCSSNCVIEVQMSSFNLQVTLQSILKAGEILSINYDDTARFHPKWKKRERLLTLHNIPNCTCSFCLDPSESGTYFSGVPCHASTSCQEENSPGFLVFQLEPYQNQGQGNSNNIGNTIYYPGDQIWKCIKCGATKLHEDVLLWLCGIEEGFEKYVKKVKESDDDPTQELLLVTDLFNVPDKLSVNKFLEVILSKKMLHETNYLIFHYSVQILTGLHRKMVQIQFDDESESEDSTVDENLDQPEEDSNNHYTSNNNYYYHRTNNNPNRPRMNQNDINHYYYFLMEKCYQAANCVDKVLAILLPPESELSGQIPWIVAVSKIQEATKQARRNLKQNNSSGVPKSEELTFDLHHLKEILDRYVFRVEEEEIKEDEVEDEKDAKGREAKKLNTESSNFMIFQGKKISISLRNGPLNLNVEKLAKLNITVNWNTLDFQVMRKLIKYANDYIDSEKLAHLEVSQLIRFYFRFLQSYSKFFGGVKKP